MITRVVGRGRTAVLDGATFAALRAEYVSTLVDVGTGDGRYVYHLASTRPDVLVVGIDALEEPLGETAAKAARKPGKGGRPNLVLVRASAEAPPPELHGVAQEITVQLPWGRLLEGIVLADTEVLRGIAALAAPDAKVSFTLNGEIWLDSTPARYASLPLPTPEYVAAVIAPGFAAAGIEIGEARFLTADEAKSLPTTWAKKLGHGRIHPTFVAFEGRKRPQ